MIEHIGKEADEHMRVAARAADARTSRSPSAAHAHFLCLCRAPAAPLSLQSDWSARSNRRILLCMEAGDGTQGRGPTRFRRARMRRAAAAAAGAVSAVSAHRRERSGLQALGARGARRSRLGAPLRLQHAVRELCVAHVPYVSCMTAA
jgi:hypothetical protein